MSVQNGRSSVDQVKDRLGIEEVVSSYMKLEKAGKNLKGKCPFHNEKTPSFYVTPDRGTYYCFGCGAKGDIFSFVQQFEGLDFMGSLKMLAERAGVELTFERNHEDYAVKKSEKDRLFEIMELATVFYEKKLAENKEAREYVKKRGITDETAKLFRIGYAPNDWRLLFNYLKTLKCTDAELEKAGLAKKSDKSIRGETHYDTFRDRIMFPISDSSGRVIAFSGRILHDIEDTAKYINSPDTILYSKSTVLYGIDKAKQAIRERGYTIMVEGQMDLVLSHQAGIKNTVAVSGTALSDSTVSRDNVVNNLGIIRRLSSNVVLAFDSDQAGRKAAMRSAQIALSLGMDVKIVSMPEGKDPADMVLHDPESWKHVLRTSKPVVEFQLDAVMAQVTDKKLDARKVPPLLREQVLPFILSHKGAMERAHFVKMIHERTGIAEDAIRIDLKDVERIQLQKQAEQQGGQNHRQEGYRNGIVSGTTALSRLDMISRKLFGLAVYLVRAGRASDSERIHTSMKGIAGDVRYHNLIRELEPITDELVLEAEISFGREKDSKETQKDIDELVLNFEEDVVKQDFARAMNRLSALEKKKGVHDSESALAEANELMKQCQVYATRLSEIAKKR